MNNLNHNFFKSLLANPAYKEGVEEFREWLHVYEQEIDWHLKSEGFGNLPYEMQTGILIRFFSEEAGLKIFVAFPCTREEFEAYLKRCFLVLSVRLQKQEARA